MKRIALLITSAGAFLISCNKEDAIVQTHQFEERTSGNLALTSVDAIVVQNEIGPVDSGRSFRLCVLHPDKKGDGLVC